MTGDKARGESNAHRSPESVDVTLAEYTALRAEIDRRTGTQWNVFALQVGSAGAISSLAIASESHLGLLLLIPLSFYMLGTRYILHDYHIKIIHDYISNCLSPRVSHALQWERWKDDATASTTAPTNWFTVAGWNPFQPTRLAFVGSPHSRFSPPLRAASTSGRLATRASGLSRDTACRVSLTPS